MLLIVLAIVGWDLLYTSTAYRPPEEKKVDFYVYAAGADADALEAYMADVQQNIMPDMEQMSPVILMGGASDDMYSNMQLSVYIMAGEGDVYLLPHEIFVSFAMQGAFLPLDDYVTAGALTLPPGDMESYRFAPEEMAESLYGIPAKELNGLLDFSVDPRNMVLCVLYNGKNDDNSVRFVDYFIQSNLKEAPQWFTDAIEAQQGGAALQPEE